MPRVRKKIQVKKFLQVQVLKLIPFNAGSLQICFSLHPAKNKYITIRKQKLMVENNFVPTVTEKSFC